MSTPERARSAVTADEEWPHTAKWACEDDIDAWREAADCSSPRRGRVADCPFLALRAAGRHHLISPAVICVSDHTGGHFYSCCIVGAKRDVACGAIAVCISLRSCVCTCAAICERKTLICCIVSCWDSHPPSFSCTRFFPCSRAAALWQACLR